MRFKSCWSNVFPPSPLTDEVVEADELYQNAGEKGQKHEDPDDPPRRRANDVKGHGTWDNDRPPIAGVIGRESGRVHLQVCHHSDRKTLVPFVVAHTQPTCTVNTDEWQAYNTVSDAGRTHVQVCHSFGQGEWARDDDGDGLREVHTNSIEGFWTGLRNFLRPFRGVNKEHLSHYIAVHEWASNVKQVTEDFLRAMMWRFTSTPT
jgi:transposase-like protein